jgi:glycosyltransferase involved in cell wall biosynthesis
MTSRVETDQTRQNPKNKYDVLVYSPEAGSAPGHSFVYAANICQEEVAKGKKVLLLTTPGFLAKHQQAFGRGPSYQVMERTTCDCRKWMMPTGFFRKLLYGWYRVTFNVWMCRELKEILRQGSYPVLHWLDNPEILTTLWFAWTSRRVRNRAQTTSWFINVHPGDISWEGHGRDLLRATYKAVNGWGLRRLLQRNQVSRIFVHGKWIKRALCSRWGMDSEDKRIVVATYGSDLSPQGAAVKSQQVAREEVGLPRDAYVVLHFGIIRRDKGLDDVVRAVSQVPSVTLVVAGHPTNLKREEIVGWVEQAGIAERTLLRLEYIFEGEIEAYFRAADVVVTAHKGSHQGASGPMHLACSYLVPIVASDCGDTGEFVRENKIGEIFPPGDWKALAEILQRFRAIDPATYEVYRERALEAREATSWRAMVGTYLNVYAEACGE